MSSSSFLPSWIVVMSALSPHLKSLSYFHRFLALAFLVSYSFPHTSFLLQVFFFSFNHLKYWKASMLQSQQQQFLFFFCLCNSLEIFHNDCVCHYLQKTWPHSKLEELNSVVMMEMRMWNTTGTSYREAAPCA